MKICIIQIENFGHSTNSFFEYQLNARSTMRNTQPGIFLVEPTDKIYSPSNTQIIQ